VSNTILHIILHEYEICGLSRYGKFIIECVESSVLRIILKVRDMKQQEDEEFPVMKTS